MRSTRKALTILSIAVLLIPLAYAAKASIEEGSNATAPVVSGPDYGGPVYSAPTVYGPPVYHGPYYGSGHRGRTGGRGSGSGHVSMSFDFEGFANGCMPWNGWWR